MSTLPQPPAPPDSRLMADGSYESVPLRAGQLTPAWRTVFVIGWACVVVCFAAVWRSARTMGLSTWWLGAASTPQFLLVQLLPFVPAVALVVLGAMNGRFLPHLGAIGALVLAAIATGDLGRFDRLAAVEFVVAGAAMLISVAAFAGLLRNDRRDIEVGELRRTN